MSNNRTVQFNLNHLPVFVAIAESKSLTDAAKSLRQDKTRVSRILAELESDLNTELVYRTTRDLRLTEAGQLFYSRCKDIVANVEEAAQQLSHKDTEISGHVCLTAAHGIASTLLPSAIRDFTKLYPRVTFEIRMTQQSLNLVKEGIDIALRVGKLEDSSYMARKIGMIRYAFVATPAFLNHNPGLRKLEDVPSVKVVTFSHFNTRHLRFRRGAEDVRLRMESPIMTNSPDLILNFALEDMALALLPELISREHVRSGQLIQLFEKWQLEPVPISLLFHKSVRKPSPVSIFIEFLSQYFAAALG